jgi:hypothetical protein
MIAATTKRRTVSRTHWLALAVGFLTSWPTIHPLSWIHEAGHAAAALVVGGKVSSITNSLTIGTAPTAWHWLINVSGFTFELAAWWCLYALLRRWPAGRWYMAGLALFNLAQWTILSDLDGLPLARLLALAAALASGGYALYERKRRPAGR